MTLYYKDVIVVNGFAIPSKSFFRNFLEKEFIFDKDKEYRTIFINRRNTRKIVNINELQPNHNNIEIVYLEDLSVRNQIQLFLRNNQCLIGIHGAGLGWISIMSLFDNTSCVEIVFGKWNMNRWYTNRAIQSGMKAIQYEISESNIIPGEPDKNYPNKNDDIFIHFNELFEILKSLKQ